jgi:hypothetical protein
MSSSRASYWVFSANLDSSGAPQYLLAALSPEDVADTGLRGEAVLGILADPKGPFVPENLRPNPAFVAFLQWAIAKHAPGNAALLESARRQGDGWVYVIDARTPTPQGPVPPEDILGAFEVRQGALVQYQASPAYRVVTSNGPPQLDPWFAEKLRDELLLRARQTAGDA